MEAGSAPAADLEAVPAPHAEDASAPASGASMPSGPTSAPVSQGGQGSAEGVRLNFWDSKVEEIVTITFKGRMGIYADWPTGRIYDVPEDSQGHLKGVVNGMYFLAIDGEPYDEQVLSYKIAREKDFSCTFSKDVASSACPPLQKEAFFTVGLKPGTLGLEADWKSGHITVAVEGEQAAQQAITPGMQFIRVNGEPYNDHLLEAKRNGGEDFEVGLLRGPTFEGNLIRALHLVSRCCGNAAFPHKNVWATAAAWQLEPWCPEDRVPGYLGQFGLKAQDLESWHQSPEGTVKLGMNLRRHVEKAGHTWYLVECTLIKCDSREVTNWLAPRRLAQLRTSLFERMTAALGTRYPHLFENVQFPGPGGIPGTTEKVHGWLTALAKNFNDGILSPETCALILFFLQAPITECSEEGAPPPTFYYLTTPTPAAEAPPTEEA